MFEKIDFRSSENLGRAILRQFQQIGFVVLLNFPKLSPKVVHNALLATDELFKLDAISKNSARFHGGGEMRHSTRGYYTFKQQSTAPIEAFQIGDERVNLYYARVDYFKSSELLELMDPAELVRLKSVRNVWPNRFKECYRDALLEYFACCSDLCAEILEMVHQEIVQSEVDCLMTCDSSSSLMRDLHSEHDHILELKHYHAPDQLSVDSKSIRFSPHKDLSSLTVLIQDEISGLEVFNESTLSWIPVNFSSKDHPNCVLINSGDFLETLSGGLCRSTIHRVSASGKIHPRNSLAFFYSPNWNSLISHPQSKEQIYAGDQMPFVL
jgi:isopenicillin N synthase-like dioxygenase